MKEDDAGRVCVNSPPVDAVLGYRALEDHGIEPRDLAAFAGVSVALFLVALVASHIPARRAMRVYPMRALRVE